MTVAFYASYVALWVLVVLQTVVLLGVTRALHDARQSGALMDDLTDTLRGKEAPAFSAEALSGEMITGAEYMGRQTALLFVSPDCETCAVTLTELEALRSKTSGSVILMCRSTREKCRQLAATYRLNVPVIVDEKLELSRLFRVAGAPTAVLIGADGRIEAYGMPMSADDLEETMREHAWETDGDGTLADRVGASATERG